MKGFPARRCDLRSITRRAALLPLLSLLLTGCAGRVYGRIHDLVRPDLSREIPLPSPDVLAEPCPPGTERYSYDFDGNDIKQVESFCAGPDGNTEGPYLVGQHDSAQFRVAKGAMWHGKPDGLWFGIEKRGGHTQWYEAHFARGVRVGHLRGATGETLTLGDYDDQGRMDGTWVIDGKILKFEHGNGLVDWHFAAGGDLKGMCKDGLRDGLWRMEGRDVVEEVTYVEGTPWGHARVSRKGQLVSEGDVVDGKVTRWRILFDGACLDGNDDREEQRASSRTCKDRALPSFWSCVFEDGSCRDPQPELHDDASPLSTPGSTRHTPRMRNGRDVRQSFTTVPISLNRDQKCPPPNIIFTADGLGIPKVQRWKH